MQVDILANQAAPFFHKSSRNFQKQAGKTNGLGQPGILGPHTSADTKPKWNEKLSSLRSQHRAMGLCMKCGEKWNKQHKCPKKISLQVLQEVLDVIETAASTDDDTDQSTDSEHDEVFQLS